MSKVMDAWKLLISKIIYYIDLFWKDVVFTLFIMSQEMDDTSFLKTMQMRATYKMQDLIVAVIAVHTFVNVVLIYAGHIIARIPLFGFTQNESHLIGVSIMIFICIYV